MPDVVTFDLKQLVRVCLNDPELRAEVFRALDEGPLPVRTPFVTVKDLDGVWAGTVRIDREKSPGDDGFIGRDALGWITARLGEVLTTNAEASTMSAEQITSQLGILAGELLK